jgi:hypothetical protein
MIKWLRLVETSRDEAHKGSKMAWQELLYQILHKGKKTKSVILDIIDCPTGTSNWLWSIREARKIPTPFKAYRQDRL